jgi:hypothetical protein
MPNQTPESTHQSRLRPAITVTLNPQIDLNIDITRQTNRDKILSA